MKLFALDNTTHLCLGDLPMNTESLVKRFTFNGLVTVELTSPAIWGKLLFGILLFLMVLVGLGKILSPKRISADKSSAYECGFAPFFIKEGVIEIQFVIVALLFLIFDLEVVYLVPLTLNLASLGSQVIGMYLGYIYIAVGMLVLEGKAGALSWPTWQILSDKKNNE